MPTLSPLRRGDDLALRLSITDMLDGPQDLTGWTVSGQLLFPACPAVECTCAWLDATAGIASLQLNDTATLQLHVGTYELRIRLTSPAGISTSAPSAILEVTD